MMRPGGVETQVRPTGWQPGANTLLYLPLESDVVDMSGKTGRTFTTSGISYTNVGGVDSIHVGTTGGISLTAPTPLVTTATANQTVSCYIYVTSQITNKRRCIFEFAKQGYEHSLLCIYENNSYYIAGGANAGDSLSSPSGSVIANRWNHIVLTNDASGKNLYINGVLAVSGTGSSTPRGNWSSSYEQNQSILNSRDGLSYSSGLNGNARELIMEDRTRTAQEVLDYYNQTKSNYGL